jgi:DNA-binding response OmpR family regulator
MDSKPATPPATPPHEQFASTRTTGDPPLQRTILVAAHDILLANLLLQPHLVQAGFAVLIAYDERQLFDLMRQQQPDLLLLDQLLARDGLELCRRVRRESQVPMMIIAAQAATNQVVAALDLGADDYLTRPYVLSELMARVRAILRRTSRQQMGLES